MHRDAPLAELRSIRLGAGFGLFDPAECGFVVVDVLLGDVHPPLEVVATLLADGGQAHLVRVELGDQRFFAGAERAARRATEGERRLSAQEAAVATITETAATTAERAFLRTVEGGCHVPVGGFGQVRDGGLRLRGVVSSLDGSQSVEGEITGPPAESEALGISLARDLLGKGGKEILDRIREGTDGS